MQRRGVEAARIFAGVTVGAAIAVLLAACSPGADYPTILDRPTPRADQTMDPAQVKQATDALISERDRLSAANAQAAQQAGAPATTGSTRTTAGSAPKP